jgi:(p)ppGpp synthase/HD superfamily hydrolase
MRWVRIWISTGLPSGPITIVCRVEIFTSKTDAAGPSRDWLTFVRSARARNKIRQWFSQDRREEAIETGKDQIAKAMRKQHLPMQHLVSRGALVALATGLGIRTSPASTPRWARGG